MQTGMGGMFNGPFDNLLPMDTYPNVINSFYKYISVIKLLGMTNKFILHNQSIWYLKE